MAITEQAYCTREDILAALDWAPGVREHARIDRAVVDASRAVEGLTHRTFYPETATRRFDWPDDQMGTTYRLWLDADELVSVTTLQSGTTTITDYFLEPANSGPPYTHIELDRDSSASFGQGDTSQRDITVTGVFGYTNSTTTAGALAEALDASETAVDVTDSFAIGVGDLILVESEYMLVTDKTMLDTAQDLQTDMTAQANNNSCAVSDGTAYTAGETIKLDTERMEITDITSNTLTVKRAVGGTTLAAHSGSDIFAPRTLTVQRGVLGSTAATHSDATAVARHVVPGPIRGLVIAEALAQLQQENAAYARTVGSGENTRESAGKGLADKRRQVYIRYGRKVRTRAV